MSSLSTQIKSILLYNIVFAALFSLQMVYGQQNNALNLLNANFLEHGDFVYLGSPDYGFTNKLTVAIWFKWTVDPQTALTTNHESEGRYANLVTIDRHNALNMGQFWLQHSSDNSKYQFDVRTTSGKSNVQTTTISNSADDGVWYFLVGVYDDNASQSLKIYLNGELEESSNSLSGNINPYSIDDRLNFGRVPSGYRFFTGNIDEIRIWNGALTQDEIRQQMFSKSTIRSADLASYWGLDQSSGTTVDDSGPQNVDGIFYSSLVDVHSYTTNPYYTLSDNDKNWVVNSWAGDPIVTVAGAGIDETNTVASNSAYVLTIEDPWVTTPVIDPLTNMTWYGIEDASESAQWVLSTAPVSENSAFVNTTTPVSVGPAGAQVTVTITSTPSSNNNLGVYQLGNLNDPAVTGETFPSGIDKRMNIVWGTKEWGGVTASLQFSYTNVPGISDPSQLVLMRRQRDSNTWYTVSATNDINNKIFTLTGVTTYYEYTIGSNATNPLPVELNSFTARYVEAENYVLLIWKTQTEINNYGFEIEKSYDKSNWQNIGFVPGNGNSNSPKEYNFRDNNLSGNSLYYRLKQIDSDGSFSYSKMVDLELVKPETFELSQNYPNPFNPSTMISYRLTATGYVTLKIYDILGNEVATLVNEEKQPGIYEVEFSAKGGFASGGNASGNSGIVRNLPSGLYFYTLSASDFSETKKMILLK